MSHTTHAANIPTLRLVRAALLSLRAGDATRLALLSGRVWVTQSGDPDDHFLQGGETFALRRGALVLIGAETDTSFQLLPRHPHTARPSSPQAAATVPG